MAFRSARTSGSLRSNRSSTARVRAKKQNGRWFSSSGYASALSVEALEDRNLLSAVAPATPLSGSWTNVTNLIPDAIGAQTMILLSDGTVMTHGGGDSASSDWYQLKPDRTGNYVNGTWSQLASMGLERLYFPSETLSSGKVFLVGGEYTGPFSDATFTNTGEIYDPVTNSWTAIANFPKSQFGDDPTQVMPDGQILAGFITGPETYLYNPTTNIWTQTGSKLRNDASDEESWVKLSDGSVLSYDIFSSLQTGVSHAQRYIPAQGVWVDAGIVPVQLSSVGTGYELGPGFLLPDGRAFFLGSNGNTAYYTPSTNTWAKGPSIPDGLGSADAPGAMLPNGDLLLAAAPIITGGVNFDGPTTIFEFNPTSGIYTDVTPFDYDLSNHSFVNTMLVLPTGQVMIVNDTRQLAVYTPSGSPLDAWKPTITDVTVNGKIVTLTGTQLNGISQGAAYGDDNEMATNFPIVRVIDQSGNVFYARTFNWSSTGVATGSTPETVDFTFPSALPAGVYSLSVIANGIESDPVPFTRAFSVTDVSQFEGDSGFTDFVFTVTQAKNTTLVTTAFTTSSGSASVGSDYIPQSGTLTFQPGETTKQITVEVAGDTLVEPDETFFLTLDNGAQGIGTILNDDLNVSINDVNVQEGDTGTKNVVFTVTVDGVSHAPASLTYTTIGDTANAGSDFLPAAGSIVIPPGTNASTKITVPIVGDTLNESTEQFFVQLGNAVHVTLTKAVGVGTIFDNDPAPFFYVNDVHVTTTQAGVLSAVFTVALDRTSGQDVTVQFATADGVAKAGSEYLSQSGTLDFPAGVTTQLVTVPVLGSAVYAANEQFYLNISNAVHAKITDPQGVGTIIFANAPAAEYIVDDGDAGYNQTAGWTGQTNLLAYNLDDHYHAAGNGSGAATWTFPNLAPGPYQVLIRWIQFGNRATNAPYTVFDGATSEGTVLINQQLAPVGDQSNGVVWQSIGTFNNSTGTLTVKLSDNANGYVIADAVRIVGGGIPPQVPEMDVAGYHQSIASGEAAPSLDDATDFGAVAMNTGSTTHGFTVTNTGNADLHLTGSPRVAITGDDAADFSVIVDPNLLIPGGAASTFQIMFHPTSAGLRTATISIANDDSTEAPYTFEVQGTGGDAGPDELIVDDTSPGFAQFGPGWTVNANALAYQQQFHADAAGAGGDHVTWTANGLAPGDYQVYTTWVPFGNRASNAAFGVSDGAATQATVSVNQQQAPADGTSGGVAWGSLGTFHVGTGTLQVSLTNQANGFVMADAVRIVRVVPAAESVITPTSPQQNKVEPLDVNHDQIVSSIDVLIIINDLISASAASQHIPMAVTLAAAPASATDYAMDVNGDGVISPRDALMVINYLNQQSQSVSATPAVVSGSAAVATPTVATAAAAAAVDTVIGNSNPPQAVNSAPASSAIVETATPKSLNAAAVTMLFASSAKKVWK